MTQNILQTLIGLGAVILLFLIMAWVMRRCVRGPGVGGRHIQLLAALSLGTREKLLLVDVGGQQLLLGATSQHISTLHQFAEPVVDIHQKAGPSEFAQKLHGLLKKPVLESLPDKNAPQAQDN